MPRLLGLFVLVIGCASSGPPPPSKGQPFEPVLVHARLIEGHPAKLDVTLSIPAAALPRGAQRVQLPFWGEPFKQAEGYQAFVSQDGAPFEDELPVTVDGVKTRYEVRLEHEGAEPRHGVDEVPHRTARGWLLVGRAFIPVIKVDGRQIDARAELRLDAGGQPVVGAAVDGARAGGLLELLHALYYVGPHAERTVRFRATTVRVLSQDYSQAALEPLAELVKDTLQIAEASFGPAPEATRLLVYDRQAQGFAGGVVGGDITLLSSTPPTRSALSPVGAVVVHELSHLWVTADQPWLSEGFNTYFELLFGLRLDEAGAEVAKDALLRAYDRYQANAKADQTVRAAQGLPAYTGGALVAFCLDAALKAKRSSVIETFREALASGPAGAGTTTTRYRAAVAEVSEEAAQRLDAWLDATTPIDFADCLEVAGFEAAPVEYQGYTLRALVVDVLRITGFSPQRAEVFKVKEGSIFEVGDVITSVNGRAVTLVPEIDAALAGVAPGTRVPVHVQRGATTVKLELEIPEVGDAGRQKKARVVAQPKTEAARAFFER